METKELISNVIDAFDKNDTELVLSHFTDDIQWTMVGDQTFSGKNNIRDFFATHPDMEMISSTKDHMVIDGDTVVVDGEVNCVDKSNGVSHNMYYCDIYELENGKVKKMTSYCVNKKKE